MEDSKQTRGTVLSWSLIGVAFVAIIILLLVKFVSDGKKSATIQSQDKLIGNVTTFASQVFAKADSASEDGRILAQLISEKGLRLTDKEILSYAQAVTDNTDAVHVYLCKGDKVVSDEKGDKPKNYDLSVFTGEEKPDYAIWGTRQGCEFGDYLLTYAPIRDDEYVVLALKLDSLGSHFPATSYEEVAFLAVTTKDGNILASFDRYKDKDSKYLQSSNILSCISQGAESKDAYNSFKVKLYSGVGCAVPAKYQGDVRTLSFASLGIDDWYLAYGVRQSHVNKLTDMNFSSVKSTVIKIGIVMVVFAVFVISTIVFNALRTKERGRVLEDKADTDLLTELNNKAATERKIQEYLDNNPNGRAMMFILDIDNFKKINDTMGHAFGDTLLKTLGKEIKTEFRMTDIIGRTGGDEFMVFLKDVTDDLIVEREANRITRFFHDFKAGGDYVKYSASASIGAAIYPDDARSFKDLYVAADQALYKAKKRGKNQLVFYNEEAHN